MLGLNKPEAVQDFFNLSRVAGTCRDAWKEVEGKSKEEAKQAYVDKLLEVRTDDLGDAMLIRASDPEGGQQRRSGEIR